MITTDYAIQMRGISKAFSGVVVLDNVDFDVRPGEVHALAGGNGAGKSTLMKVLQGVYRADAGDILIDGVETPIDSIHAAKAAGIGMVFQEFSLVPSLTVARNVLLGAEPLTRFGLTDERKLIRRVEEVFAGMGVEIDLRAEVGTLGTAFWQITEIAKALSQEARVLIMDEPTASLARHEAEALFDLIGRLKARGIAIIYISHRMDEVYRIADRITVLRDGRRLLTESLSDISPEDIVEGIVGRRIEGQLAYRERDPVVQDGPPLLDVRGLTAGNRVRDVSFTLRRGEIVGLAGLMGSGRTELARVLFGIDRADRGEARVDGAPVVLSSPQRAIAAGLALVPEDRREQGLVLDHSVNENLLLPLLDGLQRGPFLDAGRSGRLATALIERLQIKVSHPQRPVRLLSGGNQQKVVIAKWLGTNPEVLILDEPTAGVDIGTKSEILERVRDLAASGKAVIVISSEYPELLAVSDRILIIREGSIVREYARHEVPDEEALERAVQGVQK